MDAYLDVVLALLAAGGLLALGWLLFGRLIAPVCPPNGAAPTFAVVLAQADGEGLEQAVNSLLWLRDGKLAGFTVVLADCGLSSKGLAVAETLLRQSDMVVLCPIDQMSQYIQEGSINNGRCSPGSTAY
ncbi:MAG: hypothetical protein GX585_04455 [Clostridiales bacterium]|nr:hypothetical protein [Clostridiales bacterium]